MLPDHLLPFKNVSFNPLSANLTKRSNTLKQFVVLVMLKIPFDVMSLTMKAFTVGCGVIKISVFLKIQECFLGFSCILKEIGSRRKYSRQHLTEDLRLFGFSIVCVHHK